MDETLRHQRDTSLRRLEALIQQGREIRNAGSADATRAWQQDCAAAINQLSGGSKAHWLARAYSGAFMVRSADGGVLVEADATQIADRILDVLAQGASSLSRMDDVEAASSVVAPRPRRFEFVHNAKLRPVLEQTFDDSHRALEQGQLALALILSCSVIDALLTDTLAKSAMESATESAMESATESAIESAMESATESAIESAIRDPQSAMTFESRIAAAERSGLIGAGCTRLPLVARRYRDLTDANGELHPAAQVSERDARVAGQVLRVVMRDLDPGR